MSRLTLDEFYTILHKPKDECDGYELHLQHCWKHNNSKSIFYLTGLDISYMLGDSDEVIKSPPIKHIIDIPIIF